MKKYNTPEIEALALETIDVIATSGDRAAAEALGKEYAAKAEALGNIATDFTTNTWSW